MYKRLLTFAAIAMLAVVGVCSASAVEAGAPLLSDATLLHGGLSGLAFSGLIVNQANLTTLFQGFKTSFQQGVGMAAPQWDRVAMRVPSTTGEEKYGWLGQVPGMREWLGDRVIHNLMQHDYSIKNKDFELTVGVERNAIEDDQYGVYAPLFMELGRSSAAQPDVMCWAQLAAGFNTVCYDGQFFFDTDHPVLDANGAAQSVSNYGGGAGTAWYLIDTSRVLKPIIFQERKPFTNLVRLDRETDQNVFMQKKFIYGSDGRGNTGFGLWQIAYASKQDLTHDNFGAAVAYFTGQKGDHGRPLGLGQKLLLVVPGTLEGAARKVVINERKANGEDNEWKGRAELLVSSWL